MNFLIRKSLRISILCYVVLHFILTFFTSAQLELLLSYTSLFIIINSVFFLSIKNFKLPLFILLLSLIFIYVYNVPIYKAIVKGVTGMEDIIGFLIIIPLINWVIDEEPYVESIFNILNKSINTGKRFYFMLISMSQIVTYFLLYGSITILYQVTEDIMQKERFEAWENYRGTAFLRGFALTTLWGISIPSFIYAVENLNASLLLSSIQGLIFSIIAVFIAVFTLRYQEKKYNIIWTPILRDKMNKQINTLKEKQNQKKKAFEFTAMFVTLFFLIFSLHSLIDLKLMVLIPFILIMWVIVYYIIKKKFRRLLYILKEYTQKNIINQSYQISVMMAVGILIFVLENTNLPDFIVEVLYTIQLKIPLLNPLSILPFLVVLLGFLGLGPLTVMVLVTEIIQNMSLPYYSELLVLSITSGSVMSILLSPLVMPIIVLSEVNKLSVLLNGIKFNWKYALVIYLIVQLYLQALVYFSM